MVYVGSDDGKVYGMDAGTGSVKWKYDMGAPVQPSSAMAGGVLYVGSDNGQIAAFENWPQILRTFFPVTFNGAAGW